MAESFTLHTIQSGTIKESAKLSPVAAWCGKHQRPTGGTTFTEDARMTYPILGVQASTCTESFLEAITGKPANGDRDSILAAGPTINGKSAHGASTLQEVL